MARTRCGEIVAATMPSFTSDSAKLRGFGGDDDVAGGGEAHAAAERIALHARDHRPRAGMHGVEHARHLERIGVIVGVAEAGHRAHPVEIGAGAERRAARGDDHHARVRRGLDVGEGGGDFRDQRVVEGVADFGPVEPQPAHRAALLDLDVSGS